MDLSMHVETDFAGTLEQEEASTDRDTAWSQDGCYKYVHLMTNSLEVTAAERDCHHLNSESKYPVHSGTLRETTPNVESLKESRHMECKLSQS
jgi:hypothetical protein